MLLQDGFAKQYRDQLHRYRSCIYRAEELLPFWNANFAQEVATQVDDTFKFKVFWQNKMILGWDGDVLSRMSCWQSL